MLERLLLLLILSALVVYLTGCASNSPTVPQPVLLSACPNPLPIPAAVMETPRFSEDFSAARLNYKTQLTSWQTSLNQALTDAKPK